jgi:hypothetical protein
MPVTCGGTGLLDRTIFDGGKRHHACDRHRDGLAVGMVASG